MISINRSFAGAILIALGLLLGGCGDNEPDQRKAFIAFLQQINERAGPHFLNPKPEEEKAFGDYLRHYTVITDFNKDLTAAADVYDKKVRATVGNDGQARTIEQMISRRPAYPAIKDETAKFIQTIEDRVAKANAERAALKQPDDLKAVYDTTFNKLITAPARAMVKSNKGLIEMTESSMRLVDYINDHRGKLTVSGTQVRTNDPRITTEVNALILAHQEVGKRFQETQREGQRMMDAR